MKLLNLDDDVIHEDAASTTMAELLKSAIKAKSNLSHADLSDANLSDANLSHADYRNGKMPWPVEKAGLRRWMVALEKALNVAITDLASVGRIFLPPDKAVGFSEASLKEINAILAQAKSDLGKKIGLEALAHGEVAACEKCDGSGICYDLGTDNNPEPICIDCDGEGTRQ